MQTASSLMQTASSLKILLECMLLQDWICVEFSFTLHTNHLATKLEWETQGLWSVLNWCQLFNTQESRLCIGCFLKISQSWLLSLFWSFHTSLVLISGPRLIFA
jgi:hypothetical protein